MKSHSSSLKITDISDAARKRPSFDGHELVVLGEDRICGLTAIIAIHNTVLGPGLGGTRFLDYAGPEAALDDVLRLSRGMTYKASIAGLPLGGGKAVVIADGRSAKPAALLDAYARMLAELRGRFITAEDVGMTTADADYLRARTDNVSGTTIGGSGNPAPFTADGVFLGMRAAAEVAFGSERLAGRTVAVQGLGAVGMNLCEMLHAAGASLKVADIAEERASTAGERFDADVVSPEAIVDAAADIFAPCALGAAIDRKSAARLPARIVAGSANNVLAEREDAAILLNRGVLYAPDYVINAGGLINVAAELAPGGYDRQAVEERIGRIPETLRRIFDRSAKENLPTNVVARQMALERIAQAAGRRPPRS